jgi:hypothetical protein
VPHAELSDRHLSAHNTRFTRSLAGFIVNAVHEARAELLGEGGELTALRHDHESLREPDLPDIPTEPTHLVRRTFVRVTNASHTPLTPTERIAAAIEAEDKASEPRGSTRPPV